MEPSKCGSLMSLATSLTLRLGGLTAGDSHLDGSIANFRLYSKALNAGQVQELYEYQKDYFLGSRSSVTLYKGHLGVGVAEPSGQLELAGDARIQEYPPGPMSNYETLIPGHGVFCVSASTFASSSYETYFAFDNNNSTAWLSQPSYDNTTGGYTTSISTVTTGNIDGSGTSSGEWLQISLPSKIFLKRSGWIPQGDTRGPKTGVILGSNDGSEWNTIHSFSGKTYSGTIETELFSGTSSTAYQYFRIIGNTVGAGARLEGREWKLFGTPGPTTLDKGSLSLTRSLDVPRISRYDVDTETPRPEKLVVDFDTTVNSSPTDISGQGNHGAFYGNARYSAADKAFDIGYSSVTGQIASRPITVPVGAGVFIHSVSFWGWINDWGQPFFYIDDTYPVGGTTNTTAHAVLDNAGLLRYDFWSNNVQVVNGNAFPKKQWVHVGLVYKGGNVTSTSVEIYYDGVRQAVNTASNDAYTTPSSVRLQIGSTSTQNIKISNFKLYNVALEASEVKKLYNLGRTGRSMVISDTAVGIGKVPEAQLDVRGNLIVRGAITNDYYACFVPNDTYYDNPDYLSWKSDDDLISFNSGITVINESEIELGVPGIYMAIIKLNSDSIQSERSVAIYAEYYDGAVWQTNVSNAELRIDFNGGTEVMTQHMLRATTHTKWRFYITHNFTVAPSPDTTRWAVASGQWSRLMISKIA